MQRLLGRNPGTRIGAVSRLLRFKAFRILVTMERRGLTLSGSHVRPEPLNHSHLDGLVTAAAGSSSLYQWALLPRTANEAARYIDTALAWRMLAPQSLLPLSF